jgi:8-oxo-dGTP diphosphatase
VKLVLAAAVALIDPDRRVLIAQRPRGKSFAGLWEFPGGKLEVDERPEAALIRELREELGIAVEEKLGIAVEETCLAPLTFASFATQTSTFLCRYICHGNGRTSGAV